MMNQSPGMSASGSLSISVWRARRTGRDFDHVDMGSKSKVDRRLARWTGDALLWQESRRRV